MIRACLAGPILVAQLALSAGVVLPQTPTRSSAIAASSDGTRVWVVNPDSNSVSALETSGDTVLAEIPVGRNPRTLAISPDGSRVYVANMESNDVSVIDATTLAEIGRTPVGTQPYGVALSPDGSRLYVALATQARVTVIDSATMSVVAQIGVPPRPRGLAISADGARLLVTHFLTPIPALAGTLTIIDTATNTVLGGAPLNVLPAFPGVPSIMSEVVVRPGTTVGWVPMVQLETGNPDIQLTTTVHASFAVVDYLARLEVPATRTFLERVMPRVVSQPVAVDFSPNGAVAFIANMASNDLAILAASTRTALSIMNVGDAPQGVVVLPTAPRVYVSNYLGRSVSVIGVAVPAAPVLIRTVSVTSNDPLSTGILKGKKLFFTSTGRLSTDNWMACISCHPGGASDGRDWNFTRLGEGIRNTTDIRGIVDSGAVHWTANMDELQDLEFNIRNIQFGAGLVNGTPNDPFGPPNAGLSQDLDDFAAFMNQMLKPGRWNPNRGAGGGLTPQAVRGKGIFESPTAGCVSCHAGAAFTDSDRESLIVHDVGTIAPGDILGLTGFDTPSLLGLFESGPPYLHDGSAPALQAVVGVRNSGDRHGVTSTLTAAQRNDLVAYMLALENDRDEMEVGAGVGLAGVVRVPLFARDISLTRLNAADARPGNRIWGIDLALAFPAVDIAGVSVVPAGLTGALPILTEDDPLPDLVNGRKIWSIRFGSPILFTSNAPAPGEQVAWIEITLGPGASGPIPLTVGDTSGLVNNDGRKAERPEDGTLLGVSGALTIGTPAVPDGSTGSTPLEIAGPDGGGLLTLLWSAIESGGIPVTYNVYRGTLGSLFAAGGYDHACFRPGLAATSNAFADVPGDFYYLVSAVAAGFGEGGLGDNSAGQPIPNANACP